MKRMKSCKLIAFGHDVRKLAIFLHRGAPNEIKATEQLIEFVSVTANHDSRSAARVPSNTYDKEISHTTFVVVAVGSVRCLQGCA